MSGATLRQVVTRITQSTFLMFILLTAVFFLIRFAPGGPFDGERVLPREVQAQIEARFGLDAPIYIQYLRWLGQVSRGDLGYSFQYTDQSVTEIIGSALPTSIGLGTAAILLAMLPLCPWEYSLQGIGEAGSISSSASVSFQA